MGGGYSGQHIASAARALGAEVICSRRSPDKPGAEILFDSETQIIPDLKEIQNITHLLSCIPPDKHGQDPVLSHLSEQLKSIPLKWVGYLSTTGVYGDCYGNWVNEKDVPQPQQEPVPQPKTEPAPITKPEIQPTPGNVQAPKLDVLPVLFRTISSFLFTVQFILKE